MSRDARRPPPLIADAVASRRRAQMVSGLRGMARARPGARQTRARWPTRRPSIAICAG